jgi:hypothetical protein
MKQWKMERRSTRLELAVPVLVYGYATGDDSPFAEITQTLTVNVHGGLVALSPVVQPGQMILLVNNKTEAERECRVVRVDQEYGGKRKVGFEFMHSGGRFWELTYDFRRKLWESTELGHEREP